MFAFSIMIAGIGVMVDLPTSRALKAELVASKIYTVDVSENRARSTG